MPAFLKHSVSMWRTLHVVREQDMCRPLTRAGAASPAAPRTDGKPGKRSLSVFADCSGQAVWRVRSIREGAAFLPTGHEIYAPRGTSDEERGMKDEKPDACLSFIPSHLPTPAALTCL